MAISLADIISGVVVEPPRLLVYGVPGIGKTTFASEAPNPIFLFTEKGRGKLNLKSLPLAKTWNDIKESMKFLIDGEHPFETLVVDTVDWLEKIIHEETCRVGGKESIEDFGYGKGYVQALRFWDEFIDMLDELHDVRGMAIILLGHSVVRTFNNPDGDNYDQYQIALHQKAAALIKEWPDAILFANYEVKVRKLDGGMDKTKGKAVKAFTDPPRLLHTEERPGFWGKNRYGLPKELPLNWDKFAAALEAGIGDQQELIEELSESK